MPSYNMPGMPPMQPSFNQLGMPGLQTYAQPTSRVQDHNKYPPFINV